MACEDLPHHPNSGGGLADEQYSPNTPPADVGNPQDVVPNTTVKKMPNTGDPPYLAVGAVLHLGAAAMAGRSVLRRWWPGPFRRRGRPRVALRDCRGKAYLDASGRAEGVDRCGVPRCTRMR